MSNVKEPVSGDKPPGDKAPVERKEPTRFHMLTRLLWLCFYSVAMVIGGNAMLALPQIREGLWAFDDGQGHSVQRQVIFVLAFLYWAATAWYVARLTLGREFPNDYVGSTSTFVDRVAEWLPRVLSLAACLPMALFLLGTGKHYPLAILLIAVSILFVGFTWRRRKWFNLEAHHSYYGYFKRLERSSLLTLRIAFLLPHVLLVLILLAPISVARGVGAPALMLMAIGSGQNRGQPGAAARVRRCRNANHGGRHADHYPSSNRGSRRPCVAERAHRSDRARSRLGAGLRAGSVSWRGARTPAGAAGRDAAGRGGGIR